MNWALFYELNKQAINLLGLGFVYGVLLGILFFNMRLLINSIKEEDNEV